MAVLHTAFMDFCITQGETPEWVSNNVTCYRGSTMNLLKESGGLCRGTYGDRIIVGIELVTYPY